MSGADTPVEPRTPGRLAWVPNALSLARLLLGLAFPFVPTSWRLGLVLAAALSDWADGAASRLLRASSLTGRLLDPLADKVFVLAILVTFLLDGTLSAGEVALVALRDLVIGLGALWVLLTRGHAVLVQVQPTLLGKATTFAQFVFFLGILLWGRTLLLPLLLVAAGLGALATIDYLCRFR